MWPFKIKVQQIKDWVSKNAFLHMGVIPLTCDYYVKLYELKLRELEFFPR